MKTTMTKEYRFPPSRRARGGIELCLVSASELEKGPGYRIVMQRSETERGKRLLQSRP